MYRIQLVAMFKSVNITPKFHGKYHPYLLVMEKMRYYNNIDHYQSIFNEDLFKISIEI